MPRRLLSALLLLAFAAPALAGERTPTIWSGRHYFFEKENFADWNLPENQDRITDTVRITRKNNQGIFNIAQEDEYNDLVSPADTEWATGNALDWMNLDFEPWVIWVGANPPSSVGVNAVVHLISEDIYIDIRFESWTSGGLGGGFSYLRAEPADPWQVWTGCEVFFEKADWADWTLPGNYDPITDRVHITRQDNQGLINLAQEDSYTHIFSPADTEWATGSALDWMYLDFQPWEVWHGFEPPSVVGVDAVVHLISENIYLDIRIESWTSGGAGGGFSYTRAGRPFSPRVWSGLSTTFVKPDYADWTQAANQDRITDEVWITRKNNEGIFNIAIEDDYVTDFSPMNTRWATGHAEDWRDLTFTDWQSWAEGYPPGIVGVEAVLHLVCENIYLDIRFDSWTCCDMGGGFSYSRAEGATGVDAMPAAPGARLLSPYPNPFNPNTTVSFSLERESRARVEILDFSGRRLRTLHAGVLPAGTHELQWDGRDDAGRAQASGVYLVRLVTPDRSEAVEAVLVK